MKRNYVTPAIAVEYYNLTQSIAACDRKIGWRDRDCVLNDNDSTQQMKDLCGLPVYIDSTCQWRFEDMADEDSMCYHTNVGAAFTSG